MFPPHDQERCGVFTRAEALAVGLSAKQVRHRLLTGAWVAVIGRTYVCASVPILARTRCWAAFLDSGGAAPVTGPAALAQHGLPTGDERVHLSSTRLRGRTPEVVVHREDIGARDVRLYDDGLLLAERRRALVDALRWLPLTEAQRVLDEALRLRWVDASWLPRQAHRFAGRRGGPQLATLAGRNAAGGIGPAERLLHRLLRQAGISGWTANAPVSDAHGLIGYGDVVFLDVPVVLEVDGRAHHTDADRFQRDRTRQNRLVNAGFLVLRFTWADLTLRPREVVDQVRTALRTAQRAG